MSPLCVCVESAPAWCVNASPSPSYIPSYSPSHSHSPPFFVRLTWVCRFCADCRHNVVQAHDILMGKMELEGFENEEEFDEARHLVPALGLGLGRI